MLNIEGYHLEPELRVDRTNTLNGIGGGLLVYKRSDITLKPEEVTNDFNQYCQFQVLNDNSTSPLNITLFYRSPHSTEANTESLIKVIDQSKKNCLIIGDLNLPNIDYEHSISDKKGKALLECVERNFLSQSVDFPTHVKGSTLDVVFTDIPESIFNVQDLGNLGNSDHSIIKLEIDFCPKFNKTLELIRDYKAGDQEGLKHHLQGINWAAKFQGKDAEEAWKDFKETTTTLLDKYIPLIPRRKQGNPVWMFKHVRLVRKKNVSGKTT